MVEDGDSGSAGDGDGDAAAARDGERDGPCAGAAPAIVAARHAASARPRRARATIVVSRARDPMRGPPGSGTRGRLALDDPTRPREGAFWHRNGDGSNTWEAGNGRGRARHQA